MHPSSPIHYYVTLFYCLPNIYHYLKIIFISCLFLPLECTLHESRELVLFATDSSTSYRAYHIVCAQKMFKEWINACITGAHVVQKGALEVILGMEKKIVKMTP